MKLSNSCGKVSFTYTVFCFLCFVCRMDVTLFVAVLMAGQQDTRYMYDISISFPYLLNTRITLKGS